MVDALLAGGPQIQVQRPTWYRDKRIQSPKSSPRQNPMPRPASNEERDGPEQWAGQAKTQEKAEADSRIPGT